MTALRALERDKDIPMTVLVAAMEEAILNAYDVHRQALRQDALVERHAGFSD